MVPFSMALIVGRLPPRGLIHRGSKIHASDNPPYANILLMMPSCLTFPGESSVAACPAVFHAVFELGIRGTDKKVHSGRWRVEGGDILSTKY